MPRLPALVLAVALFLVGASTAHAGLSTWSSLPGLNALSDANWVRVYATDTPPNIIYAGTEGDGVYKSVNAGVTWTPFSAGLDAGARNVRTIFTSNSKVYAGTEDGLWATSGGAWSPMAQGPEEDPENPVKLNHSVQTVLSGPFGSMLAGTFAAGVFKSSDGGKTWTPPAPANGMPAGETVWSLAKFANFVFAATTSGIYRSFDFGATWTLASGGIPSSATTLRVFGDDKAPNIYYAGTASNGMYRSINGGLTWQPINDGLGNMTIRALVPFFGADQTRLYAA